MNSPFLGLSVFPHVFAGWEPWEHATKEARCWEQQEHRMGTAERDLNESLARTVPTVPLVPGTFPGERRNAWC
jgi:hypothetical protein